MTESPATNLTRKQSSRGYARQSVERCLATGVTSNADDTSHASIARRTFLQSSAMGLGSIALASMLQANGHGEETPDNSLQGAIDRLHLPARAKRVIFLFMAGGPSHIDLFDPKPLLSKLDGENLPAELAKFQPETALARNVTTTLKGSPFKFAKHGQSGTVVSELMPHLSSVVDDVAVIRSMKTTTSVHDPGVNMMNCGSVLFGRPTLGAWLSYGLGSENRNLPNYIVLTSGPTKGSQPLLQSFWGNGFLDSKHQGVPFLKGGEPVLYLNNPEGVSAKRRREQLDLMAWMNQRHYDKLKDPEILSRVASYEMAFRMQSSVPELTDLSQETKETLAEYGAELGQHSFANNCLLARRLVERDVRFVQLYDRGWDSHTNIDQQHKRQCGAADKPIAALLKDLKQRGLLDDTLVIWGGEFGRSPVSQVQGKTWGRDHHPHGFTMWMAGGGVKGGLTYGATDELGYQATENVVNVRDLHATILHLMGIDHHRFKYRFKGLDLGLTGVEPARVVKELLI